ncbi:hypothetical protein K488DRAFT_81591 [Vararia minispora EC-137]|uniref:Uncharacterized protein n=1 Tax=Vararia minispora EC-137 TaxID=1314806 RepID=A0ACB8QZS9_9AGAM|nr:hypothetical protein K488DRAFT_81591 [Vararia minispora EC-137]
MADIFAACFGVCCAGVCATCCGASQGQSPPPYAQTTADRRAGLNMNGLEDRRRCCGCAAHDKEEEAYIAATLERMESARRREGADGQPAPTAPMQMREAPRASRDAPRGSSQEVPPRGVSEDVPEEGLPEEGERDRARPSAERRLE